MAIPIKCIGKGPGHPSADGRAGPRFIGASCPWHVERVPRSLRLLRFCFIGGRKAADAYYGGPGAGGGAHTFPLILSARSRGKLETK